MYTTWITVLIHTCDMHLCIAYGGGIYMYAFVYVHIYIHASDRIHRCFKRHHHFLTSMICYKMRSEQPLM